MDVAGVLKSPYGVWGPPVSRLPKNPDSGKLGTQRPLTENRESRKSVTPLSPSVPLPENPESGKSGPLSIPLSKNPESGKSDTLSPSSRFP
ncbi:hypothetical protein KAM338_45800 [Aeromonas caviae]|nr:hypothetical protein KAM338_45800 [Aeromonas caviae]